MFFSYYYGLTQPGKERWSVVINEQVLAVELEIGLLTRGPVPWGLSQCWGLSPGSGQFQPALAHWRPMAAFLLLFILLSVS